MKKKHWPGSKFMFEALGPGGSAGSIKVPVPVCGLEIYNMEFAKQLNKVDCKSCRRTTVFGNIKELNYECW
jgi:hypothetical protein